MSSNAISQHSRAKLGEYWSIATWMFLGVACLYGLALRVLFAWRLPLWLDESWTAVLSSAPSLQSFIHQMWLDSNAPLYYFFEWLWPFEGDFGLRLPSMAFLSLAAIAAFRWGPLEKDRRLFWGALLVLWPVGISLFFDARYYALLYLLATLQTIAYARLFREPTLVRASSWTGICTLAILTHYYAAMPALLQGLFYLGYHRRFALRTWPAALLVSPALAWVVFHWGRLILYAQVGTSWYATLTPVQALRLAVDPLASFGLIVGAILLWNLKRPATPVIAIGVTAIASIVALLALAIFYPIFTPRYLIPMVPPLLFCIAATSRRSGFLILAAIMFLPTASFAAWSKALNTRANYSLERAALSVPAGSVVTWMIDYAGSRIHEGSQMERMLADAFKRARKPLRQARWGTDLIAANALIVFYENGRPRSVQRPKNWNCNEASGGGHTALVCINPRLIIGR